MAANTGVLPMENKKNEHGGFWFFIWRARWPHPELVNAKQEARGDDIDDLRKHDDSLSLCYRCFSDF